MKPWKLTLLLFIFPSFLALAQNGVISGVVKEKSSSETIPFANILILEDSSVHVSDLDGNFEIKGLPNGIYDLKLSYLGYRDLLVYEIEVLQNRPVELVLEMEPESKLLDEVVVRSTNFSNSEQIPVSLRTIGVAEIKRAPGGDRDISKVIQSFPGVTSTASFRNDLIIRGGAPNENAFILDGVEIPNINHFATQGASGGPAGILNVDYIREVDFYASAFPAESSNSLSSVMSFKTRNGRTDRLGLTATIGASDLGLSLEGPLNDGSTFLLSARRSYLQFLFALIDLPFLPQYMDFQGKWNKKWGKHELSYIGVGAIDQFKLNLDADPTETNLFILEQLPINEQWNYTQGFVYRYYTEKGFWEAVLSRNMLNNSITKYEDYRNSEPGTEVLEYQSTEAENKFKFQKVSTKLPGTLSLGLDYQYVRYFNTTSRLQFDQAGPSQVNYKTNLDFHKFGFFVDYSRDFLADRMKLKLGLRMDGNSYSDLMAELWRQTSPRLSISYLLADNWRVNASAGWYHQLPPYTSLGYREEGRLINKENGIKYISALNSALGFSYDLSPTTRISLEGYLKMYQDYPLLVRNGISLANLGGDFGVIGDAEVVPDSKGRAYGVELFLQQRFWKGWYGLLSYTYGEVEFKNANGDYAPSSWDARHILSITAGKRLASDWEFGVKYRYQSGLPNSPNLEGSDLVLSWDRNNGAIPDYSRINTLRDPGFGGLDIRIDKKWNLGPLALDLYLDIKNITAASTNQTITILDRETDENDFVIGEAQILNPNAPVQEQRYKTKQITEANGSLLPTIGVVLYW